MSKIIRTQRLLTQNERMQLERDTEVMETLKKQFDQTRATFTDELIGKDQAFAEDMRAFYQDYNEFNAIKESIESQVVTYRTRVDEDALQEVANIMKRIKALQNASEDR